MEWQYQPQKCGIEQHRIEYREWRLGRGDYIARIWGDVNIPIMCGTKCRFFSRLSHKQAH